MKVNLKIWAATAIVILGCFMYLLYGDNAQRSNHTKKIDNKSINKYSKADAASKLKIQNNKSAYVKKINKDIVNSAQIEEKSGSIENKEKLPWEDEDKFLIVKKKYNTNIRMAAFKTVLPDPLPGEEENVGIAADKLAGTVISPGEVFSQNAAAGPYTTSMGYKKGPTYSGGHLITTIGGGVCKIATTLYNVAIMSNLAIIERHNHSMIVPYVPPGQDATVCYGTRDVKFMNNKSLPILLWARAKGNVLYMAIYGHEKPPKVTWYHKTLSETDTYYIRKYNPDMPKGTKKIIMEGYKGYKVKTWITLEMPDGSKKTKDLGVDWYSVMPGLVEIGTGK
jgi:hypothetical protein